MDLELIKSITVTNTLRPFLISLVILLASFALIRLVMLLTAKLIDITKFNEQREKTVKSVIDSLSAYFIITLAIVKILSEFGLIKQSTLITGAGVLTVVAGFGAQNLVKDVINGFFILFERQMKVGDFISINDSYSGFVEEIGLRSTAIREWSMKKVYIPNGEIKTLKNYYKERARVILEIVVPFEEDHDLVQTTLESVCCYINKEFEEDLYKIGSIHYADFSLYGVMSIDGKLGGAKYIITGVVNPRNQWIIRNRSYEYILRTFQENGIRVAYPRIYFDQH